MNRNSLDFLRNHTVFWSRMGMAYQPPRYDKEGNLVLLSPQFDQLRKYHDQFADAGVEIHSHILNTGWVGPNTYDYSLCDKTLDELFASGKVKYFIPRVKLSVPVEWCKENPSEVCVYYDGPRTAEEIQALVDTPLHDWLGYDAPEGIYSAGGWKDDRPNVGGTISMESLSSEKWLQDASEALLRLLDHLENGPYAEKIIGYHVTYGISGESVVWGRMREGIFADYGITNQKNFREWGIKTYGSEEAMYKAWGISEETEIVPPPERREGFEKKDWNDLLKSDDRDRWSLDYDKFIAQANVHALNTLGKLVKERTGKLVGAFYGYILHMDRASYSGHTALKELLESPYIDFIAAPKSYRRCAPGEPGGEMAPVVSINKEKLWMDECDNRTHLTKGDNLFNAENLQETKAVILRETCKNISHNSGLWYMDLGGGWFDNEQVLAHIKKLVEAKNRLARRPYESTAEIVAVIDQECIAYVRNQKYIRIMEESLRELQLCGAPIDVILASDLKNHDFSKTKLVYFLNAYTMTSQELTEWKATLPENCHLMWLVCGGITGNSFSLDRGKEITGFGLKKSSQRCSRGMPLFAINEGAQRVFLQNEAGESLLAANETGDLLCAVWEDCVNAFRAVVEYCGIKTYAPKNACVYGDSRFISIFPRESMEFTLSVKNKTLRNLVTDEVFEEHVPLSLSAKDGIAFEICER